jgi:hypothetical protein
MESPGDLQALGDELAAGKAQRELFNARDRVEAFLLEHLDLPDAEFAVKAIDELGEDLVAMRTGRNADGDLDIAELLSVKQEALALMNGYAPFHYLDAPAIQDRLARFLRDDRTYRHGFSNPRYASSEWSEAWSQALQNATPGFAKAEQIELISAASRSRSWPGTTLRRDEVPASWSSVFVLFERPVLIADSPKPVSALAWLVGPDRVAVMLASDPAWGLLEGAAEQARGVRSLQPSWYGEIFFDDVSEIEALVAGPDGNVVRTMVSTRELARSKGEEMQTRFAVAFFRFINQRIITADAQDLPRQMRRAQARAGKPTSVQLFKLRRTENQPEEHGDPTGRHISVQYYVNPFWRNQWYPSIQQHRPVCVIGHWRGPADGPISDALKIVLINR